MLKSVSFILLSTAVFGVSISRQLRAGDDADNRAKQTAKQFLQAVKAKDVDAMMKVSGVPWFDPFEEQLIKDQRQLRRFWTDKLRDFDYSTISLAGIEAESYGEFRGWSPNTGNDEFDAMLRKSHAKIIGQFDKVLDRGGWIVKFGARERVGPGLRFLLIRVKDGEIAVVGGPSGNAYLNNGEGIPADARAILEKAARFELLSLDPKTHDEDPTIGFHGWKVLGKAVVDDAAIAKKLVVALKQGAEESDGAAAGCFHPRHGIHVTHNGKSADFVICFECLSVNLYVTENAEDGFQITRSPQPVFDEVLKKAGVPLAEKPTK
jgi:hypothetical protein